MIELDKFKEALESYRDRGEILELVYELFNKRSTIYEIIAEVVNKYSDNDIHKAIAVATIVTIFTVELDMTKSVVNLAMHIDRGLTAWIAGELKEVLENE